MKYRLYILGAIFLFTFGGKLDAASLYDYGLYLRSHAVAGTERTSLFLDDNRPFAVKESFTVSFQMYIRDNEPDFGSILHLQTNTGQLIRLSFIGNEEKHVPALVLNEGIVHIDVPIERERWIEVSVQLCRKDNVAEIVYDGKYASAMVPLQGLESVTALFGVMKNYLADVAPVNIREVHVTQDGRQTREWKLWKHNDDCCYDELEGAVARAQYPVWLIDNHIEWKPVYQARIPEKLDVAFDARSARFYLVGDRQITVLDEDGIARQKIPVNGGYPAINYSNHLLYDTLSNSLVSYSLRQGTASRFSFDTGTWSNREPSSNEPRYYNHARTFNPADSSFYFFGGYGFYQYRNDLYCMKSGSGKVEQVEYEHPSYPRFSAAMAVIGDELYIFGGRGNKYGKQVLTSEYFYGLCSVNLKTRQSRQVWKRLQAKENTIMASSMYFEPSDSSFYAVSMEKGGILWKVSIKDTVCTEVSKPIANLSNYQDLDFCLYASSTHGKLFLVMDKILSDHSHDLAIYSINMPLVDKVDILQAVPCKAASGNSWWLWLTGGLLLLAAGLLFTLRRTRKENHTVSAPVAPEPIEPEASREDPEAQATSTPATPQASSADETILLVETPAVPHPTSYYDRSRASISLLGSLNVRDKQGNDITTSFTPRLKHLLILLVLYTEKHPQGILTTKGTEILWPDKEEASARNNRNVTLRKLRLLLKSIGDVEIITENNFMRIRWGEDVFCDYHTTLSCINRFREQEDDELLNRILELLLYGPLLPNTILNWLDNFKDAYSSSAIDLLRNLLERELQRNHQETVIRLADLIFLHDPLNEEALTAKCAVLSAQGKKGIARNVYDRFCKEYRNSMGEAYKVPFAEL